MRRRSHVASWLAVPCQRRGVLWAPWPPLGLPTEAVDGGRGPHPTPSLPQGGGGHQPGNRGIIPNSAGLQTVAPRKCATPTQLPEPASFGRAGAEVRACEA
ncbi:hypothetical protein PVAP13_2NG082600 [Panicum virgatum]|uniref:Uncharacterized protein n=1 Tax=Panicum virgatum TaxID=38727 RepID=A0A8T0VKC1_PANVG|nr:hypothetical protein PVAP13_2NG082600 [Panicum virgatum]